MKRLSLIVGFCFSTCLLFSQLQEISDKTLLLKGEVTTSKKEKLELDTLWEVLRFYREFENSERKLNGKANFGFLGNESDLNNIFRINAGVQIDNGVYPYELDLKSNFQTLISNGEFTENLSDIDISFDYHPRVGNGLFLEIFTFLSRFNNTYLGIDQRYEAGIGVNFNIFSSDNLTATGMSNRAKLSKLPEYKLVNDNYWKCYNDACQKVEISNRDDLRLTGSNIAYLESIRYNFDKTNIKKYSKWRFALLSGIYFENEMARLERNMIFNGVNMLFTEVFETTSKLRWEIRPTFVWQPSDIFKVSFYPYFKFPLTKWYDEVAFNDEIVDKRVDSFYDIQANISAKLSKQITLSVRYRYLRDNAPKRIYRVDNSGNPILIVGQETNSFYNIDFTFGF